MSSTKSHWPLTLLGGSVSMLNMFLPLFLVKTLAPEAMGHYKIFFLWLVIMPLFCLTTGIPNGLSYWVGHDEKKLKAFRTSWTILLLIAVTFLSASVIAYPALIKWLDWNPYYLRLFIWSAFVQILATFFEEATVSQGQIWRGALFASGFDLTRNMSMLVAVLIFRNIAAVFWANLIVVTLKVLVGFIMGYRDGFQRLEWNPQSRAAVLRYAFPASLAGALGIVTNYNDQVMLSTMISPADFALYSMGCLSLSPLMLLEQAVNRVLIPRLSKAFATGRTGEARQLLREATSELSWIFIPSTTGLIIFAEPIITLLMTKAYLPAAIFLRISALRYINLSLPFDAVARARGKSSWVLRQFVIFGVISTSLVFILTKQFGAVGAIIGAITSGYMMRFTAVASIKKTEGWALSEMMPWGDWGRYVAFALLGTGAAFFIKPYVNDGKGGLKWFLVGGTLFSIIYMAGTLGTFLRRRLDAAIPPQVLYLTQFLGLGGLERMILNLARGVKEDGKWAPTVLVYQNSNLGGEVTLHPDFERAGIPVINMDKKGGVSLKVAFRIALEVIKRRISVVHSHDLGALIYAVLAKFISFGAIRIVHTQHTFVHLDNNPRYRYYERFFTLFVDELSTVGESLKTQYGTMGVDTKNIVVIPNGVEFPKEPVANRAACLELRNELIRNATEQLSIPALQKHIDRTWVLCMARLHPRKGQEHVLEVWTHLSADVRAQAVLIFLGIETLPGALAVLKKHIADANNPPEVIYAGYTMTPTKWLSAADISISGSEFEGMPLGPLEAVGSGMRVVVSDIAGHSMLPASVGRFSLDNKSLGATLLAAHIAATQADPVSARTEAWKTSQEARDAFGIPAMVRSYQALYAKTL